jgi:ABC-type molybdate transport system permease subunit
MGNYATIRIDQWGFYSIVSILRNDGFTHISIDRGANLELLSGVFAFCALFFVSIFMLSAQRTTYDLNGNPVANSLELGPLVLGVAVLLLIFVAGFIGSRISTAKRRKLAELIASDVKASLID